MRDVPMWCFWTSKGGVGCTVVATAVALMLAERSPTLLIDLGGDAEAVVGSSPGGPGLADWLATTDPPLDALSRLEAEIAPGLGLLPWGDGDALRALEVPEVSGAPEPLGGATGVELLTALVDFDQRHVVVDVGLRSIDYRARSRLAGHLLALASRSTLVTAPCYLSLRAAGAWPAADEVIVVGRQGRALGKADVEEATGAPVACELRWDPAVARAVDSGLLAARRPRSLRALSAVVEK